VMPAVLLLILAGDSHRETTTALTWAASAPPKRAPRIACWSTPQTSLAVYALPVDVRPTADTAPVRPQASFGWWCRPALPVQSGRICYMNGQEFM
jgi:hypothetical protein